MVRRQRNRGLAIWVESAAMPEVQECRTCRMEVRRREV